MKKLLIALLSLYGVYANAQELEKGLLWKISGNGLEMPSYVFGTIHATCDATLSAEVLKAIDDTSQLYLELDMDSPTLATEMLKGVSMKDGKKISVMLNEEEFKKLDTFLKENTGLSATLLDSYKPFIIESLLLPKMLYCEMQSFEMELMKRTQMQQEEIFGLETVQEQLAVFDDIPYDEQLRSLLKMTADNMAAGIAELKMLMVLHQEQDLNKILEYMQHDSDPLFTKHTDVLLTNRNKNWIPKIETAAKALPTLFAVGAAHLAGKDGIIMLLRDKGYKVEPIVSK
jgi:uncharacterized protein YbaP (TraB family)